MSNLTVLEKRKLERLLQVGSGYVLNLSDSTFEAAHNAYMMNEPCALFYRVATELVERALRGESSLRVPEALAVLLQTWSTARYQFRPFNNQHFDYIEFVVLKYLQDLLGFRARSIESFSTADEAAIRLWGFRGSLGLCGCGEVPTSLDTTPFPPLGHRYSRSIRRFRATGEKQRTLQRL
jgi:hypothetical protein